MSSDFYLVCHNCKSYCHLGTLRAAGFNMDTAEAESFLYEHRVCIIKLNINLDCPDDYDAWDDEE